MVPAPRTHHTGWQLIKLMPAKDALWSITSGVLVMLMLLAMALAAGTRVKELDRETTQAAKASMSLSHPDAMCIPGLEGGNASYSSRIDFVCTDVGSTGYIWERDDLSLFVPRQIPSWPPFYLDYQSQAIATILALYCSGAVEYYYTAEDVQMWANSSDGYNRKGSAEGLLGSLRDDYAARQGNDRRGACLTLHMSKVCQRQYSNAIDIFANAYYNHTQCDSLQDTFNALPLPQQGLVAASKRFKACNNEQKVTHSLYVDRSATELNAVSNDPKHAAQNSTEFFRIHALRGTWKVDMGSGCATVWMGINQTNDTARFLGRNKTLYEFWFRNSKCHMQPDNKDDHAGQSLWLMPHWVKPYECEDGVNQAFNVQYSGFQTAAQLRIASKKSFFYICVKSYADLYAIYTAVLGALFGSVVLLIAGVVIVLVQINLHVFMPVTT